MSIEKIETSKKALINRFESKLQINPKLHRKLVGFGDNKKKCGYRWFKYREGFSTELVKYIIANTSLQTGHIFDPFAGTGAALFTANEVGFDSTGIELLPVGCEVMKVRHLAVSRDMIPVINAIANFMNTRPWQSSGTYKYPHLPITDKAFPVKTEKALSGYVTACDGLDETIKQIMKFAAMCVLEDISYTRKDGQYLRWDCRCKKKNVGNFRKSKIMSFEEAITSKLKEIDEDLRKNIDKTDKTLTVLNGSCLRLMDKLSTTYDGIITSPPYCNRYDYTRTYALELAFLGVTEESIKQLRQEMLSCTVENRDKIFEKDYGDAIHVFKENKLLGYILDYLEECKNNNKLNNNGIARMVKNYFLETAIFLSLSHKLLKPGAPLVIVNDNVRYAGIEIPLDLIISEMAEALGFQVEVIWVLPSKKGNSSQQMKEHGKEGLRKCVYVFRS